MKQLLIKVLVIIFVILLRIRLIKLQHWKPFSLQSAMHQSIANSNIKGHSKLLYLCCYISWLPALGISVSCIQDLLRLFTKTSPYCFGGTQQWGGTVNDFHEFVDTMRQDSWGREAVNNQEDSNKTEWHQVLVLGLFLLGCKTQIFFFTDFVEGVSDKPNPGCQ